MAEVSFDGNDDETTTVTVVFAGEGVYEDQTAVVEFAGGDYPKALRGAIPAGPPPPPFDPASFESVPGSEVRLTRRSPRQPPSN